MIQEEFVNFDGIANFFLDSWNYLRTDSNALKSIAELLELIIHVIIFS